MAPLSDALAVAPGPRPDDRKAAAAWRARMTTDAAKAVYRRRAAASARVDARARGPGSTRFILRGLDEAGAVACGQGSADDVARAWRSATACAEAAGTTQALV